MQIYITDSDYDIMKQLESLILTHLKLQAKCFTTHQLLLDAVRKTPPDIVLVDMDAVNGSSAVHLIQSVDPEIGIILMSAERAKVSECFKHHTDGFLLKPIDEEKLKEQLYRVKHPLLARIKYGNERKITV